MNGPYIGISPICLDFNPLTVLPEILSYAPRSLAHGQLAGGTQIKTVMEARVVIL